MKVICGLGNPGGEYQGTRHNAGFVFVDRWAEKYDFPDWKEKSGALISEKGSGDEKVILVKPQNFMNKSGGPLAAILNFYKVDLADLVVVYDDVDLPLGEVRYREEGGSGTHNGMKSVIAQLGGGDFPRLRLGVESRGESAPEQMDISDFVLSAFKEEEVEVFEKEVEEGIEVLDREL
jgi:peptidyl-tRNA hydrolase, PTH1 family